jgi:hypothetical protein
VRTLRRLVGAVVLLAGTAAPAVVVSAPAHAAACTSGGVTVVVDQGSLGGAIAESCVADGGGKTASALFGLAGHDLTYVQRYPGAVCKVDKLPSDAGCVAMPPADKYWGLFWSDGKSGSWTFASEGVKSLTIPSGGAVAFAWQDSTSTQKPGIAAPVAAKSATVTSTKSATPKHKHTTATTKSSTPAQHKATTASTQPASTPTAATSGANAPTSSASRSVSPGVSPSPVASAKAKANASAAASTSPAAAPSDAAATPTAGTSAATAADATPTSADGTSGGLPGWVAPAVVIVVLGAGGGIAVARRRLRG